MITSSSYSCWEATSASTRDDCFHVVIVGGGIAGLTCAKQLLQQTKSSTSNTEASFKIHVTMIEATDRVGGRIRKAPSQLSSQKNPCPDEKEAENDDDTEEDMVELDLGAEFIHGHGHVLWDWIREYQQRGLLPTKAPSYLISNGTNPNGVVLPPIENGLEPYFLLAHADGGPDEQPTPQGKYGMYYIDNELVRYDDPKVEALPEILEKIMDYKNIHRFNDDLSVGDLLAPHVGGPDHKINRSSFQLLVSGYGNTAGSCNLNELSARQLTAFEQVWKTQELEGDFRPTFGMYRLIEAILGELQSDEYKDHFTLCLNSPVHRVLVQPNVQGQHQVVYQTTTTTSDGAKTESEMSTMTADAVVVTVPTTQLAKIFDNGTDLTESKRLALQRIGHTSVMKVCCKFRTPIWPDFLQSIVAAEQPIPEMWFRQIGKHSFVAVAFLTSAARTKFKERIQGVQQDHPNWSVETIAGNIVIEQLCTMVGIPIEQGHAVNIPEGTIVFDWKTDHPYVQGGYTFPKVGMTSADLFALAEPINHIFFAGEGTNTGACCTVQAAMQTGIRAAEEVVTCLKTKLS